MYNPGGGKEENVRNNHKNREQDNGNAKALVPNKIGHVPNVSSMLKSGDSVNNLVEHSNLNQNGAGTARILSLCLKGEWLNLEQLLRNTEKGSYGLSYSEEVNALMSELYYKGIHH